MFLFNYTGSRLHPTYLKIFFGVNYGECCTTPETRRPIIFIFFLNRIKILKSGASLRIWLSSQYFNLRHLNWALRRRKVNETNFFLQADLSASVLLSLTFRFHLCGNHIFHKPCLVQQFRYEKRESLHHSPFLTTGTNSTCKLPSLVPSSLRPMHLTTN